MSILVNGMSGTPRSARPVRLVLAHVLGGDIDGAWWPHTASAAAELPGLIAALHRPLGEIVNISVNWGATDAFPDLDSMRFGAKVVLPGCGDGQQRLMVVDGRRDCAKLLVVPHRTTQALGMMVLRKAAGLPVSDVQESSPAFETADRVVRAAQTQSALWAGRVNGARIPEDAHPATEA